MAGQSDLAHRHTPPVDSFTLMRAGREGTTPFLHSFPSSCRDSRSSPHAQVLAFYSWREPGERPHIHDFVMCVTFAVGDFVVCISLHCGSNHVNSPPCGLFFLPHAAEKSIAIGFPTILVCCGFIYVFGLLWVLIELFLP